MDEIVSFDDEMLICVDDAGVTIGYADKRSCHLQMGRRHLAFSIFLFNTQRQLLIQKRSSQKMLWGGFWSNSVCSHPRKGETLEAATQRRLRDELGLLDDIPLSHLFTFNYQAQFKDIGSENEHCSVYIGTYDGLPAYNTSEIEDMRWISIPDLTSDLLSHPELYTPWFKQEWTRIIRDHLDTIEVNR